MEKQERIIIEVDESEFEAQSAVKKTIRVLSFRLGTEHYCIDIADAKEVFSPISITRVPNTPAFIIGVTNLHGEIVPLVDIKYFLGLEQKEGFNGTKVITTDIRGNVIGLVVDDVNAARDIEEESIQPPLATIKGRLAEFTSGQIEIGKGIFIIINIKKILNCEEMGNLNKGGNS